MSSWIQHVKKYCTDNHMGFGQALQSEECRKQYQKVKVSASLGKEKEHKNTFPKILKTPNLQDTEKLEEVIKSKPIVIPKQKPKPKTKTTRTKKATQLDDDFIEQFEAREFFEPKDETSRIIKH